MAKKSPNSILIEQLLKPCECGECDDCLYRIDEVKEKPFKDLFIRQINHYNRHKQWHTHYVDMGNGLIMEIIWDNGRWDYRKHEVETPIFNDS